MYSGEQDGGLTQLLFCGKFIRDVGMILLLHVSYMYMWSVMHGHIFDKGGI